jgi:hypothetical protein
VRWDSLAANNLVEPHIRQNVIFPDHLTAVQVPQLCQPSRREKYVEPLQCSRVWRS